MDHSLASGIHPLGFCVETEPSDLVGGNKNRRRATRLLLEYETYPKSK